MTTASTTPTLEPADPRNAPAPIAIKTSLPELVEALKRVGPLQGMEQCEYEWLATHGTERLVHETT